MKLKIKTSLFQDMVTKAVRGVGNNKLIPITQMMAIRLKDKELTLITTNATNYLYIKQENVDGDDFEVTILAETFSKLISKLTCETVTLELTDSALTVVGNGSYSLEIPQDENGKSIKFPDPLATTNIEFRSKLIHRNVIDAILNGVKPSVAETLEVPCYTGFYCKDDVIATDTYKIAELKKVGMFDDAKLLNGEFVNLLDVIVEDDISVFVDGDAIVIESDTCDIYTKEMYGIEDFAVDAIKGLLDTEFSCSCKIPKLELLRLLDRLSLFVGAYDNNGVEMTFAQMAVQINSKSNSGTEGIQYVEKPKNFKPFRCSIDITMLTTQIKALSSDVVNLYYDPEITSSIKLVDGELTQIIALLED